PTTTTTTTTTSTTTTTTIAPPSCSDCIVSFSFNNDHVTPSVHTHNCNAACGTHNPGFTTCGIIASNVVCTAVGGLDPLDIGSGIGPGLCEDGSGYRCCCVP
ncbi:unnamed protein product, partial [Rotaria sp. Silwood1]